MIEDRAVSTPHLSLFLHCQNVFTFQFLQQRRTAATLYPPACCRKMSLLCDLSTIPLLVCISFLLFSGVQAAALPAKTPNIDELLLLDEESYSFTQFLSDFGRFYDDRIEYLKRERIFYENLRTIVAHNRKQQFQKSNVADGHYWMGVNPWADRRADELFRGYDKRPSFLRFDSQSNSFDDIISSQKQRRQSSSPVLTDENESHLFAEKVGLTIDTVSNLPKFVDWRLKGVTTPVKSQGMCGSCWAFASAAVLESHVAIQTNLLFEFSPQQLVSCAQNPSHCGGNGGCAGATAEIAFNHVKEFGAVAEWQFGYQDNNGAPINCTLSVEDKFYRGAVAGITDYLTLPSNNYTVLMNVVAKMGPVAVSVACLPWHLYKSGIFYHHMSKESNSSTDLNHLVVIEGYGSDDEIGLDYWIVRNSWGPRWGEHGYIRLKRIGEKECAIDETPANGIACTLNPDGSSVVPIAQKICGNSGILYDSVVPLGGYLL